MINNSFNAKLVGKKIWAIGGPANDLMYLVEGTKKALLIDTGVGVGNLCEFLRTLTCLPVTVVNTHGHPDHGGGNSNFSEVFINFKDYDILKMYTTEVRKEELPKLYKDLSMDEFVSTKAYKVYMTRQGKKFDLGERQLEVIETPGHTCGSICLLDREAKLLFSGDTILGTPWIHLEHSTSLNEYLDSLYRIRMFENEFEQILPGHFPTPIDKEYLYELIDCAKKILSGKCSGDPISTHGCQGLLYKGSRVSIIYNKDKLF